MQKHSRRDFLEGTLGAAGAFTLSAGSPATAAGPRQAPRRWRLDPGQSLHVQGANAWSPLPVVWRAVPADLHPACVVELANYDNTVRAARFEACIKEGQASGIQVAPEIARDGRANDSI